MRADFDVVVVGAGPAGATLAILLARAGRRVCLLDRAHFPRFVIGESLLPGVLEVFARLGIDLQSRGYQRKEGAQFVRESTGEYARFGFEEGLDPSKGHAFHVDRASFDQWLCDIAAGEGGEVRLGVGAADVAWPASNDEPVALRLDDGGQLTCRYLVDASGGRAWLGRRRRSLQPYRQFGRAGVHARYSELQADVREELEPDGDIKIMMYDDIGWGWVIPLAGGELSIGAVSATRTPDHALYEDTAGASPLIRRLTAGARRSEVHACGNFSFRNLEPYGHRYACIGDAKGFLDPLFSSGVTLAMVGAMWTADTLTTALEAGREGEPGLMADVQGRLDLGYDVFERMLMRFYGGTVGANLLLAQDPPERLRRGLVSILGGDVWREDNDFQRMLLSAQRV